MSKHKSTPLVPLSYRSKTRKTEYQRNSEQAAKLERAGKFDYAEQFWINCAFCADNDKDIDWATSRAHYCAKSQGKDVGKGDFSGARSIGVILS